MAKKERFKIDKLNMTLIVVGILLIIITIAIGFVIHKKRNEVQVENIENAQVAILVTLYDPQGASHQGSQTAAPTVAKILAEVLPYLGIEPDQN